MARVHFRPPPHRIDVLLLYAVKFARALQLHCTNQSTCIMEYLEALIVPLFKFVAWRLARNVVNHTQSSNHTCPAGCHLNVNAS